MSVVMSSTYCRAKKTTPRGFASAGRCNFSCSRKNASCSSCYLEQELDSEARGNRRLERVVLQELRIDGDVLRRNQRRQRLRSRVEQRLVRRHAIDLLIGRGLADGGVLVEEVQ